MHRYLVTGTDTDVGKTRVAAALGIALRERQRQPTIVKLVQTGSAPDGAGDARRAGALAGVPYLELARFARASDPWSAALAEGTPAVRAEDLVRQLERFAGAVVAEGAGGIAAPLNRTQHFGTVAQLARMPVVVAVGLRLGCMNHALLTLAMCEQLRVAVAGVVLVDRWKPSEANYIDDVTRVLREKADVLGMLPFDPDEQAAARAGAKLFEPLMLQERSR